ncbi:hypothetical protein M9H77_23303 [Catharanthus roseus]|uniref:Uncharacterized protein n=1 Tax=Catharanthus roseus TaxID=4058 RepID=A0ACC0AUM6_CATRO|nr:hypothetical protein M9H77_23303 [Catharanthus roseus]
MCFAAIKLHIVLLGHESGSDKKKLKFRKPTISLYIEKYLKKIKVVKRALVSKSMPYLKILALRRLPFFCRRPILLDGTDRNKGRWATMHEFCIYVLEIYYSKHLQLVKDANSGTRVHDIESTHSKNFPSWFSKHVVNMIAIFLILSFDTAEFFNC